MLKAGICNVTVCLSHQGESMAPLVQVSGTKAPQYNWKSTSKFEETHRPLISSASLVKIGIPPHSLAPLRGMPFEMGIRDATAEATNQI